MKFLRNYLLQLALNKHRTELSYKGWKNVSTIQVLFDEPKNSMPLVNNLVKRLEAEGKKVQVLHFKEEKKPKENSQRNTYYLSDVSYLGRPKKAVFSNYNQNTDVLIDWTKSEISPNDFLSANSNAGFKIGIDRSLACFDFTIKQNQMNAEQVTNEILKYLKMINHDD